MTELPPSQPPPPTTPPLSGPPPVPAAEAAPEPALELASWGPGRAFGGLGFLVGLVLVLSLIVVAFDKDLETLAGQVTLQALLSGSLIFTAFLFAGKGLNELAPASALGLRRPLRNPVWLAVVTYFGYVACALAIAALLSPHQEDITRDLGGDSGALGKVIAGVLIVIAAPISEEIFFRGFLFSGLRKGMNVIVAALVASAIWGVFHFTGPGSWGVVVQITVFGLWLSWLYMRTGSIYATIAVHAVNNAIAFALLISS